MKEKQIVKRFLSLFLSFMIFAVCSGFITNTPAYSVQAGSEQTYSANMDVSLMGGVPTYIYENHTVEYDYKVVDIYTNPYGLPRYASAYDNSCALNAAGGAIAYYDKFYDELIPNHTGFYLWGNWVYGTQGAAVNTMYDELYSLMGTTAAGTTLNGYLTGFSAYASGKGRTAQLTKCMQSYSKMNASQYKAALSDGKLVTIFVDTFSVTLDFVFGNGSDYISHALFNGAHIMMAYGYFDISYYRSDGSLIKTYNFLQVSTGLSTNSMGYINLNQYCVIDDAYITHIY